MAENDNDFFLREEPGPDPLPPQFSTEAWLRMVDAEVAAACANGRLAEMLGDFEKNHCGEPFVWYELDEPA